jgi:hypothetical protein
MTPVNRKAGTGERTRELPGETPGIFIVLSGFATDLSVRFCDACQGAEPMEKRLRRGLIASCYVSSWHLPGNFRPVCKPHRSPQPNDRAQRVSERGSGISPVSHILLTRRCRIFPLPHKHFPDTAFMPTYKPVYTPLALRDWSGAAPGTRKFRN